MSKRFDTELKSPEETLETLDAIMATAEEDSCDERRIFDRSAVLLSCLVQPLDDDFAEKGTPIFALLRDVSVSGIGFLANEPITENIVRIDFTEISGASPIFLRIKHEAQCGAFFVFGGEVAVNWDSA